jgi:hypothetical protein
MPHPTSNYAASENTHHRITLSDLDSNSYKAYSVAAARIYHTPFGSSQRSWSYSQLKGLVVFGGDRSNSKSNSSESSSIDDISSDTDKFWFRLVDSATGRTVWIFKVPAGLDYQMEKPFFHIFSGKASCLRILCGLLIY